MDEIIHAPHRAQHLLQQAQHLLPEGEALSVDITPVLGPPGPWRRRLCLCHGAG